MRSLYKSVRNLPGANVSVLMPGAASRDNWWVSDTAAPVAAAYKGLRF